MADLPLDPSHAAAPTSVRWTLLTRLAFRFAFCYFLVYALCCGNATLWEIIPWAGGYIAYWLAWPFEHAALWLGQHMFHLQGVGARLHGGGSGDKALDWIAVGVMLAVAIVATLLWSLLDRRSVAYPKLFTWFRFIIRLTLGVAMIGYGLAKVFPLQMAPPSLAVLNEPFGNTSPMTLLWTLIGLNPIYEIICGSAEVIAGVLILFRRTALLGALITAFVVTNIVLYNFFFDVPVKIYAAHLLLMALVLIVPDVRSLFRYFWRHVPTAPTAEWSPWLGRRAVLIEDIITAVVLVLVGGFSAFQLGQGYMHQRASIAHPSPLTGEWRVESALLHGQPKPYLTGDGQPMVAIFLEPSGRTMLRSSDNVLWRAGTSIDLTKHTFKLHTVGTTITYAVVRPDPSHLVLTPTGASAKTSATLQLTRVPLPTHYPLLDRGFHFVNEWGLER